MSTNHAQAEVHFDHNENIDHQGNANFAVWLGLVSLTFLIATFVACNVYLRGWAPSKFHLGDKVLTNLPYLTVLLAIVSVILLFVAASFFAKDKWRAFNLVLALITLVYIVQVIVEFNLMLWFAGYSKQVATIYAPTAIMEFALTVVYVMLLVVAGWYASFANKRKINSFFPVGMNVWLYAAFSNVVILLIENVLSVGQFAAWFGQHLV